jgi:S-adenosylmethionine hydrolase
MRYRNASVFDRPSRDEKAGIPVPPPRRGIGPFVLPYSPTANTIPFVGNASAVACITDFGTSDYYAGALRGTLADLLPGGSVIDVTHEIPPGDIRRAALVLWEVQPAFPKGTVFLTVVDPGVGSRRAAAAIRFPDCTVVCPDNGAATLLMERGETFHAVALEPRLVTRRPVSNTFHGRDLFAPAAARLARGIDPRRLGTPLPSPVRIPLPVLRGGDREGWEGEILYADRFGNAITSIGRISFDLRSLEPWLRTGARGGTLSDRPRVLLEDGSAVGLGRTYAEPRDAQGRIALVGSNGLVEIASWNEPAGGEPALRIGARVRLENPA